MLQLLGWLIVVVGERSKRLYLAGESHAGVAESNR